MDNSKSKDLLFYFGLAIWICSQLLLCTVLFMDTANYIIYSLEILGFLFVLLYEISSINRYTKYDVVMLVALSLIGVSAAVGGSTLLAQSLLLVYIGRSIDLDSIFQFTLKLLCCFTAAIVALSILGVLPDLTFIRATDGEVRHSLGFSYPSRLPNIVFAIFLLVVYVYRDKGNKLPLLAISVLSVVVYLACDTRGPFYLTLLGLIGIAAMSIRKHNRSRKITRIIACSSFVLGFCAIALLAAYYDPSNPLMKIINDLTSNRMRYSHSAFLSASPTLFGTDMFSGKVDLNLGYLDSAYLQLLFIYGLVPSAIMIISLTVATNRALLDHDATLAFCLIMVGIHGVLEWQLTSLMYTPFLFALTPSALRKFDDSCSKSLMKGRDQ